MTNLQKQCLLLYLGYYTGEADGIWGPLSVEATRAFQRAQGLEADGIFGVRTQEQILKAVADGAAADGESDWWADIRYFTRQEFACPCGRCDGYPSEPEEALVRAADTVRAHFGSPALISSGLRCPDHNAEVGGVPNSRHLVGKAMDFRISGQDAETVLAYVQQLPGIRYAYAIDSNYVHMDIP